MNLVPGQRIALTELVKGTSLVLSIDIQSPHCIDYVCFGLDAGGRLQDDRYMVFFNQPQTPCASIRQTQGGDFSLDLATLPASIDRLSFTASIDGAGAMRDIRDSRFSLREEAREVAVCNFSGSAFSSEKAIMVVDLYRKAGGWRLTANLQGYNDGLAALVRHFGGEVADEAPAATVQQPAPAKLSLDKRVADLAPHLVSLAKKAQVSLEKAQLTETRARVGLVLDASGSMNGQYSRGRVQEVLNRLLPLAVHFDDDGALDCWAFAAKPQALSPVTLANHKDFIASDNGGWRKWELGSRINNEPKAMRLVIDHYKRSGERTPAYILFISDGGVHENRAITTLMKEAASLPIFWQFVGLGGNGYGILEKLDDMPGRVVDNCSFFALDELDDVEEGQLYDMLMEEFPGWLKAARQAGIIT